MLRRGALLDIKTLTFAGVLVPDLRPVALLLLTVFPHTTTRIWVLFVTSWTAFSLTFAAAAVPAPEFTSSALKWSLFALAAAGRVSIPLSEGTLALTATHSH